MRSIALAVTFTALASSAFAHGATAARISAGGRLPLILDHEPGPELRLIPFQVVYIDDRSCPAGEIKKLTVGSKHFRVHATRECVSR